MFAYAGIFLMAFAIMTSVTYFVSLQLGGFTTLVDPVGPGLISWHRLYDALYATANIAGGSSEGAPDHVLTMFIGMLGTITYLLLTNGRPPSYPRTGPRTGPDDPTRAAFRRT